MKFVVGVPWRSGNPHRENSWRVVRNHLAALDPYTADATPTTAFSRAATCNQLADRATRDGADIVIFHDADMVAPSDAYNEMAELAYTTGRMVIGFTEYRALGKQTTNRVLHNQLDPLTAPADATLNSWSQGGINAIRVDAFKTVGGYDERFRGWGCEDFAFAWACNTILGPTLRTPNVAVHLWHPHGTTTTPPELVEANTTLLARYNAASGNPTLMQALLDERKARA